MWRVHTSSPAAMSRSARRHPSSEGSSETTSSAFGAHEWLMREMVRKVSEWRVPRSSPTKAFVLSNTPAL